LQRYEAEPSQAVLRDMDDLHVAISNTWEEMLFESMVVGEGLALVLIYFYHDVIADAPIRRGLQRVIRDEESHVAYGEQKIMEYVARNPELREHLLAMQEQLIQHYSGVVTGQTPADGLEEMIAQFPMAIIQMHVTRYDPDRDTAPTFTEYEVPLRKDWAILDGLNYVKDHVDGSLSYRWSCRMGICGSCGMNVDGQPKLTCATFLTDYAPGPIRVEPLTNFPVVRDLVVDIEDFMGKLPRVKPWIIRDDDQSVIDGEYLQTPEELEEYQQFSNCINCMLCYAACPVYGLEPDFIGPAAIALAERYDLDSRDRGQRERLDVLIEREGVWGCTFVGECTRVCPKHVDPAGAIQRYKLKAAKENVMAFLLPRGAR